MSISLYSAVVPPFEQVLRTVAGLVAKAEAHCTERGIAPAALIEARLADDMLPFAYQVKSTAVHSIGAIEGVRQGRFSPDIAPPPDSFAGLADRVAAALDALGAIAPDEIDGWIGRPMRFEMKRHHADFTAETFLFAFSKPNFYFHATTAYDILRANGLMIGKADYLGRLAMKRDE